MSTLKVKSYGPEEAQALMASQLEGDMHYRKANFEAGWKVNEGHLFGGNTGMTPTLSYNSLAEVHQAKALSAQQIIHMPRIVQNLRFLQSQMSANPPSVTPSPVSNERTDQRATEAVDDLISYGRHEYELQEYTDLTSLSTLTYGSGFLKAFHDPHIGKIQKHNKETDEIQMEGDFSVRPVLIWDIWFDKDAKVWADVRYIRERHLMPFSQAISIWPEYEEMFMANIANADKHPEEVSNHRISTTAMNKDDIQNALVEIYEYTEKGLAENGMAGRRCFHLRDGHLLGEMTTNPHPGAKLPYGILTDIDVPGEIYGKTTVDFAIGLARVVDSLDNMILDNVELHGSIKLVVFDDAETNEKSYSDNPTDIISVNGTHAHSPFYLKPASVSMDLYNLRNQLLEGIDGVMGVNEILQGKIERELSGFASQTAINAANMVRHRLFNKYTKLVRFVYETFIESVVENWKTKRQIQVIGKEDAQTVRYLNGADIAGGYVIRVEYGTNFSLDPAMRREEIIQAREILLGAGITDKKIAQMLKYNEIDALFDAPQMSRKRQIEIFERAIDYYEKTKKVRIDPASKMRKAFHLEMAEAAMEFVMTNDFLTLDEELKEAIYNHIDEREALAAQQAGPPQGEAPGQPPAPGQQMGQPAGLPMPAVPDIGGVL